jgi:hypothetical protein
MRCIHCHKEIWGYRPACPNCGGWQNPYIERNAKLFVLAIAAVLLIAAVLGHGIR